MGRAPEFVRAPTNREVPDVFIAALWASLSFDGQVIMLGQAMGAAEREKAHSKDPQAAAFTRGLHGAGVNVFVMVPNVDRFHAPARARTRSATAPDLAVLRLRDMVVTGPGGDVSTFDTPIKSESCRSCGMPLTDAETCRMDCASREHLAKLPARAAWT